MCYVRIKIVNSIVYIIYIYVMFIEFVEEIVFFEVVFRYRALIVGSQNSIFDSNWDHRSSSRFLEVALIFSIRV